MLSGLVTAAGLSLSVALVRPEVGTSSRWTRVSKTPLRGIDVDMWDYTLANQDPGVELPAKRWGLEGGEAPFPISKEDLETLKRDGVVHIKQVLDPEWLNYARTITDRQVSEPHIWASPGVASGLYDYIQRNIWTTNDGFAKFLYHSPVASVLAQLGGAKKSVRVTTDLLMVNPNKGFKWHQDNQNGPVSFDESLRFWVTMDDTPRDYGAPVYLRRSHENKCINEDAVFVDLDEGDLPEYSSDLLEFRPKAGDMLIWHPRTIHKIDGPESQDWGKMQRRVLGGTVALDDAIYYDKEKVEFADMGRHSLRHGDLLQDPHFPQIWPAPLPEEVDARFQGRVGRSLPGFFRMWSALFSTKTYEQFASFGGVVKKEEAPSRTEDQKDSGMETTAAR